VATRRGALTTIVCTHNGISTALDVHDDSEIEINGVCAHTPNLDKPEKPKPLSETIQVGDVVKFASRCSNSTVVHVGDGSFAYSWRDGRFIATHLKSALDEPGVTLVSRAADKSKHERIIIGKTVLRFPEGKGEYVAIGVRPIREDERNGYEASWGRCSVYWHLSDCEIVSGAR